MTSNLGIEWKWIAALIAFAGFASCLVRAFVRDAIVRNQPWAQLHRATGWLLAGFTIAWIILFAFSARRFGRRICWALIAFPLILYWDAMWFLGLFFATIS